MVSLTKFLNDPSVYTERETASLAESVEFESENNYREKLETLKQSYFAQKSSPAVKTETLSEGLDATPESTKVQWQHI